MSKNLDEIDLRILAEIQADGRITNVELAKRVGISPPPCLRRVRTLEEEGYIQGYRGLLDPRRLGFDVTVFATDQRTGRTSEGQAIAQNDLFGFHSLPALTTNPDNPEMFVKIIDGRTITGAFWVFFNGLTDVDVVVTVRDNTTGAVKTYHKEPGSACGGFDTQAFQ